MSFRRLSCEFRTGVYKIISFCVSNHTCCPHLIYCLLFLFPTCKLFAIRDSAWCEVKQAKHVIALSSSHKVYIHIACEVYKLWVYIWQSAIFHNNWCTYSDKPTDRPTVLLIIYTMVSAQQTSLCLKRTPFSPKVYLREYYRTTSQCVNSYGCAITIVCLYIYCIFLFHAIWQ